ncbi:Imm1 family immunity protein [Actinokineospora sp.]|uniref:Imm1 family immunity protein n=1 Tax=Actinokineospora sp. TaxID=1872133 RepID=UPI0040384487
MAAIPEDFDLVTQVQELNAEGVEIPWVWVLSATPLDLLSSVQPTLTFGINNKVGALEWIDGTTRLVPASGTNPEWQIYHLAGMHDTAIPPYAEVPVEVVFEVLAEFLDTQTRPTKIEWQDAAPFSSSPME